ncbi:MAG TPA: hypothetical protein VGF55_17425 [Gemmataceae bacterium]|jgi:hypothetical protein
MRRVPLWLVGVALAAGGAGRAEAGLVQYTDRAAFTAAAAGTQTIDFDGIAPAGTTAYRGSAVTAAGVTFSDATARLFAVDGGYTSFGYSSSTGSYLNENTVGANAGILATLPAGVTAVGADLADLGFATNRQVSVVVTTATAGTYTLTVPHNPDRAFVGFTSDAPITSISFAGDWLVVDNFTFGPSDTSPAPAPPAAALLGMAVLSLGGYGWRRWKAAAA